MSNEATFFTTVSGRVVDLFRPAARDIDFGDVAESLAKEPRYNGHTPGVVYSVAQHLVLGAEWIVETDCTGIGFAGAEARRRAAAYFLCHDFHEYALKDDTTPKKRALDQVAMEFGTLAGAIAEAYARLTERWDAAIHAAAGLEWPPPQDIAALVGRVDRRMLLAEWAALRPAQRLPARLTLERDAATPLPVAITPWDWHEAEARLRCAMWELLPALDRHAAPSLQQGRPSDGQGTFSDERVKR